MRKKSLVLLFAILFSCMIGGFVAFAQTAEESTSFTKTEVSAVQTLDNNTVVYLNLNDEKTSVGTYLSDVLANVYLNGKALNKFQENEVKAQYVTEGINQGQIQLTFLNHASVFKGDGKNILTLRRGVKSDSGKVLQADRAYRVGSEPNVEIVMTEITSISLNSAAQSTGSWLYLLLNFDREGSNVYIADIRGSLLMNGVALPESNYWENNVSKQYNFSWPYETIPIKNDRTDCITLPAGTMINEQDGKEVRTWKDQTFYYYDGQWSETPSEAAAELKVSSLQQVNDPNKTYAALYVYFNKLFQTAATGGDYAKEVGFADKIKINGTAVSEIEGAEIHAWELTVPGRLEIRIPFAWSGLKQSASNVITLDSGLTFPRSMHGAELLNVRLSEEFTGYFNPALNILEATATKTLTPEIGACSNSVSDYVIKVWFKDAQGQVVKGVQAVGNGIVAILQHEFVKIDGVTVGKWAAENNSRINAWYGSDGSLEIHLSPTSFNDLIAPSFAIEVCDGFILVEEESKIGESEYTYSYGGMVTQSVSKTISMPTYKASENTGNVFTRDMNVTVSYNPKGEHKIVLEFPSKAYNPIQGPWWNDAIKEMILINDRSLAQMMKDAEAQGITDGVRSYFNDGGYTVAGDFEIYISSKLNNDWNLKGDGTDRIKVKRGMPLFKVNKDTKEETLLGMLSEEYELNWEGTIKDEQYLTELNIQSISGLQVSADAVTFKITFDRDVCYGYMPHINAPADWLKSESEKVNSTFRYSDADLTYITLNGVQNAVNDLISVEGKTLGEYNSGDSAHYPVAVMVHYGVSSADVLQITFRTDMANGPDWSKDLTLTIKSGFVTPLGGKLQEDVQYKLNAQTNKWSEVK